MTRRADIVQLAYIVRAGGLNAALDFWVDVMGAGPFFRGVFPLKDQIHKGKPTDQQAEVACGYHGDIQIELIEPHNDAPGPYNDFLAQHDHVPVGGLYHHVMVEQGDYDASVARLLAGGCKEAFSARNEMDERICYLEAKDATGGYIEVIESTMWPPVCAAMRAARESWDGSEPVRSFETLLKPA